MASSRSLLRCCLTLAAVAAACANDATVGSKFVVSGTFGPAGGILQVSSADSEVLAGASLSIPPNALDGSVLIGIGLVDAEESVPVGATALGPTVDFEPSGLTFAIAATLELPLTAAPNGTLLIAATEDGGSSWVIPASFLAAAEDAGGPSLARASITSFTEYRPFSSEAPTTTGTSGGTTGSSGGTTSGSTGTASSSSSGGSPSSDAGFCSSDAECGPCETCMSGECVAGTCPPDGGEPSGDAGSIDEDDGGSSNNPDAGDGDAGGGGPDGGVSSPDGG